jgi:hypothetical protein
METIKRDDDRVNISKASASDISGGYIMKYDNNNFDEGDTIIQLHRTSLDMVVVYPKADDILPEQKAWLYRHADFSCLQYCIGSRIHAFLNFLRCDAMQFSR